MRELFQSWRGQGEAVLDGGYKQFRLTNRFPGIFDIDFLTGIISQKPYTLNLIQRAAQLDRQPTGFDLGGCPRID